MIIYKPLNKVISLEKITDAFESAEGALYYCKQGAIPHHVTINSDELKLLINSPEPVVFYISSEPALVDNGLVIFQSGSMDDIAQAREFGWLKYITKGLSTDGIISIMQFFAKRPRNGSWLFLDKENIKTIGNFEDEDGIYFSSTVKKKSYYYQSPMASYRSYNQSAPAQEKLQCVVYAGITFAIIPPKLKEFIENNNGVASKNLCRTFIKDIGSGKLSEFGLESSDLIFSLTYSDENDNLIYSLLNPLPQDIVSIISARGIDGLGIRVIRMDSHYNYTSAIRLTRKKKYATIENDILSDAQRRWIVRYILNSSGITDQKSRIELEEQLHTLSDQDLLLQNGVEKSGYQRIKN